MLVSAELSKTTCNPACRANTGSTGTGSNLMVQTDCAVSFASRAAVEQLVGAGESMVFTYHALVNNDATACSNPDNLTQAFSYKTGCVEYSATESVLSSCSNDQVDVKVFDSSTTCSATPSSESKFDSKCKFVQVVGNNPTVYEYNYAVCKAGGSNPSGGAAASLSAALIFIVSIVTIATSV